MSKLIATLILPLLLALSGCESPHAHESHMPLPSLAGSNAKHGELVVIDGDHTYHIAGAPVTKVGDAFLLRKSSEIRTTIIATSTKGNPPNEDQTTRFEIIARMEVTATNPQGTPTAFALTVQTCTGSAGESLLAPGRVIDLKKSDKGFDCSLRGTGALDKAVSDALLDFDPMGIGGDIMGDPRSATSPDSSHKIGETISVQLDSVHQESPFGPSVDMTNMHAQVVLKDIEDVKGIKALRIEATFSGTMNMHNLPLWFTAKPSDMTLTETLLVPADRNLPPLEIGGTAQMNFDISGSILFIPISMNLTMHMHQTQTLTPIEAELPATATAPH